MFPFELKVVSIPVKNNFRAIKNREIAIFQGPEGWSEFSPFLEYGPNESAVWLKAAIEAATKPAPKPIRELVEINATLPNVKTEEVASILEGFHGCTSVKIKINDFLTDHLILQEVLRVIPKAKFRLDINGGWQLEEAVSNLTNYEHEFPGLIDYVEQPCIDLADIKSLRGRVKLKIAVDESIRKFLGSDLTKIKEVADIAIIKWAPSGGISAALEIIEKIKLPVVVSSALESSIGISHGVALASVVPNLYGACGLGTTSLLAGDVTSVPLVAEDGFIKHRRITPDLIEQFKADPARVIWWQDRVNEIFDGGLL
ncbi:MAG: o-succinylbenzoate synthase [Candidatus Nanopelagicus sp.]